MKNQLHQRRALNALTLHAIDSGDVEEMILVVVSQVAFHLGGIHSAVWLSDVNGRIAHLRENIHRHPPHGEIGKQRDRD